MPLGAIKQIADGLHAAGCLFIALTGGEVFARPDIGPILEYLWGKGFIITIATNGSLIDEDLARFLSKAAAPTYLRVTLYASTEGTMKYVTGAGGVLKKTIGAIELLKKYRVPFALDSLVTKNNIDEMDNIRAFAKKHEVLFQYQYLINPRLDGSRDVLRQQAPLKDVEKMLCAETDAASCGGSASREGRTASRVNPFYCSSGRNSMAIDARGKASACINLPLPGVDILNSGVEESWRKVVKFVDGTRASDKYKCPKCELYEFCTWCPAMGWLYNKDLNSCVPFYKREAWIEKAARHG